MKTCFACKERKSLEEFALNRKRYDGRQTLCRQCKSIWDKRYYRRNRETHYLRTREYLKKNKIRLFEYFKLHPCVDCGQSNPVVLELDHVRMNKTRAVSNLVGTSKSSWSTIQREIDKCDVRCANCHRIKTAKELGWYQYIKNV